MRREAEAHLGVLDKTTNKTITGSPKEEVIEPHPGTEMDRIGASQKSKATGKERAVKTKVNHGEGI